VLLPAHLFPLCARFVFLACRFLGFLIQSPLSVFYLSILRGIVTYDGCSISGLPSWILYVWFSCSARAWPPCLADPDTVTHHPANSTIDRQKSLKASDTHPSNPQPSTILPPNFSPCQIRPPSKIANQKFLPVSGTKAAKNRTAGRIYAQIVT